MMLPCIVNSWLNTSGPTKALRGEASCARISIASTPAITKNTQAVSMKRMPRRLWLTEVKKPRQPGGSRQIASSRWCRCKAFIVPPRPTGDARTRHRAR